MAKASGKGQPGWRAMWWAFAATGLVLAVIMTYIFPPAYFVWFVGSLALATWLRGKVWHAQNPDYALGREIQAKAFDACAMVCTTCRNICTTNGENAVGNAYKYRCNNCGHQTMIPGTRVPIAPWGKARA